MVLVVIVVGVMVVVVNLLLVSLFLANSFLSLAVRPGAPSGFLAPSSDALCS